jgi:hypothetical protein
MIIMATAHNTTYTELADATWHNNKLKYAEKHGYSTCAKTSDWVFEPRLMGWERMQFISDILENYADAEWVWWTGTDSMVTNFDIKIEDKIAEACKDQDYDIIVSCDFNEIINNDSMLVRNSENSRDYFKYMMHAMPDWIDHKYSEQGYMIDNYEHYSDIMSIQPQKFMNSYEYKMYTVPPWNYKTALDVQGNDGQWSHGDWLVHWPGTQLNERMVLLKEYQDRIIY